GNGGQPADGTARRMRVPLRLDVPPIPPIERTESIGSGDSTTGVVTRTSEA
ncbi:unnamed protein product, partial [Amoebophrya sp. A25]